MDNILDSDDPMVALMVRAIGQTPIPNQPSATTFSTPTNITSPTTTSPGINILSNPSTSTSASATSTPIGGVSGAGGAGAMAATAAAVEFLDAEAETAVFLDSMNPTNTSLASPLPLPLPWSPSQDMIWTEDELLVGPGDGGSQQSVDMALVDDISGMEMVSAATAQELEEGRGVLMEEDDEVLPVVVVETVAPLPQPVSPVVGFGLSQRLHQQHHQQQGGVRYNPQQSGLGSSSGINRGRSWSVGKLDLNANKTSLSGLNRRLSLAGYRGPGAGPGAERAEFKKNTVASIALTEKNMEEEKSSDMDVDTPEAISVTVSSGTGVKTEITQDDDQPINLRDPQISVQQPSSPTDLSTNLNATSVLAPALEITPSVAPPTSISGPTNLATAVELSIQPELPPSTMVAPIQTEPGTAIESKATEPRTVDPLAVTESIRTDSMTTSKIPDPSLASHTTISKASVLDEKSTTASTSASTLLQSPSSSTKPNKATKTRRSVPVQLYPSWHFALGSDIAFLSEMKGSNADLKRFRREHEWLEERVRRPKRDHASDQLLDKALGLTRMVVVPPELSKGYQRRSSGHQPQQSFSSQQDKDKNDTGKEPNGDEERAKNQDDVKHASKKITKESLEKDGNHPVNSAVPPATATTTNKFITPVRLSTDSRLAFSLLKTNLSAQLEEQSRLETDQRILERIIERTVTKVLTTTQLHSKAEERLRELQVKQPDQERELQKLEKLEKACLELRDRQRQQAEEEIRRLEETVRLLECQREQKRKEEVKRVERERVEMAATITASEKTTMAH